MSYIAWYTLYMDAVKYKHGGGYSAEIKDAAIQLRKSGRTHREIASELKIALGSAHLWTTGIVLSDVQKIAIFKRRHHHKFTPEEKALVLGRIRKAALEARESDDDLINKIRSFYNQNGRIPLKRELNSLKIFRERFGSWNNAISLAGFNPNPVLFAKKFIAKDGHKCDSFTEKIIDDWLHKRGISHDRSIRYGATKMTVDFFIKPNIAIEFFGLAGVQKKYDSIILRKRALCEKLNWRLIEIYPRDVFEDKRLPELLRFD